jgi:pimeloyl-[acyl-carrier protein] methyl ester esterase
MLLAQSDLRSQLPHIHCAALVVHGACDRIALPGAGERLAQALPEGRFVRVDGAGHAPFLSHAHRFVDIVGTFLRE